MMGRVSLPVHSRHSIAACSPLTALTMLIALVACVGLGCSSDDSPSGPGGGSGTDDESLVLDFLAVAVNVGGSQTVQVTTENGEAAPGVTVVSEDPTVASVEKTGSSFSVSGESAGSTTIEVRDAAGTAVLKRLPASVYDHTVLDVGDLLIKVVDDFDYVWADAGSGSPIDLSVHHPVAPEGFYPLGSVAADYWPEPAAAGIDGQRAVIVVKNDPNAAGIPATTAPDSFELVANVGWNQPASIWRPVPLPGYKAVGLVLMAGFDAEPSDDAVRCVREDLTFPTDQFEAVWTRFDPFGSPTSLEVDRPALPTTEEDDIGRLASGSFRFKVDGVVYGDAQVLRLQFPLVADAHSANWPSNTGDVLPAYLPNLDGQVTPQNPYAPPVLTKVMLVPLMAVNDPDPRYPLDWRVANSPFYQVERNVGYKLVDCVTSGNEEFTTNIQTEVGSETAEVETFTESTTWSVSANLGVKIKKVNLGVSGTFSKTFGYSQSRELSEFETRTVSQPVFVPANGIGCYWNVQSVFTIRRHTPGGPITDVSSTGAILENGNVHVDSWP